MNRIHIVINLQITAYKREIKDFPKLPSATSFKNTSIVNIINSLNMGCKYV